MVFWINSITTQGPMSHVSLPGRGVGNAEFSGAFPRISVADLLGVIVSAALYKE